MVPPIAAVSFIRLLCGMCSADVALRRRRVQGKMDPSERYNCVCRAFGVLKMCCVKCMGNVEWFYCTLSH